MGALQYGQTRIDFDDRTLVHLQIVISGKLRRGESFFLSWIVPTGDTHQRHSVWLSQAIPIGFTLQSARIGPLNREWLEDMAQSANSDLGLMLRPEVVRESVPEHVTAR